MKKIVLIIFKFLVRLLLFLFYAFSLRWKSKLIFLLCLCLFLFSLWLFIGTLTGGWLKKVNFNQYQSLEKVADAAYSYDLKKLIKFSDLFPEQKHSVLIDKIVVNLKTPHPQFRNPMGVFQFYLRVDSKKTAVEIKKQQKIIADHTQREIEEFTYDEVTSLDGKKELKSAIQVSVNEILPRGQVEEVYFKHFITKP